MNIILISNKSAQAKNIVLPNTHLALAAVSLVIVTIILAMGMNYLTLHYGDKINDRISGLLAVVSPQQDGEFDAHHAHLHDNLDVLAVKLGQMQAQLMRLDALGERLAKSSGIKTQEFLFDKTPGQGGALPTLTSPALSVDEFKQTLNELSYVIDDREDKFGVLDSLLRQDRLTKRVYPSEMPVDTDWYSSGFGYRIDPFSGRRVFHEGVDFAAKTGTPIKAAAGGVVIYSARHPEYGNMVEIDHGDELVSRYAHASKRLVNLGQIVSSGQKIAEVGSTGRSTGPHLHFEIRHKDVPQNPSRYLKKPS